MPDSIARAFRRRRSRPGSSESIALKREPSNAQGVRLGIIGTVVPSIAAFCTAPIVAHALGVTGRGEAAAATAPLLLAAAVLTLGLPDALTYFIAQKHPTPGRLLGRSVITLSIVGLIGTLALLWIAPVLSGGDADLTTLIRVAAMFLTPALLVALLRGIAIGRQQWARVAIETSIGQVFRLAVLAVLGIVGGLTVTTVALATVSATFIGAVAYLGMPVREDDSVSRTDAGPSHSYSVPAAGTPLLRYGAGVWFGSVSGILFLQLDQVLMTPLSSSYQLGLYVVAVALSQTVTILTNPVRSVLFSAESRSPDMARLTSVSRQTAIAAFIGALAIAIATPFVLPILFGVEFASAVPIVFILLAATVAGTSGSIAGMGLSARGRPGARSLSLLAGFLINLLLVLLLVGPYGGIGAAWATFAGSLTISIVNVIQLRFYFHVPVSAFFAPRRSDFEALVGMVRHWVPARRRRRRPKTFEPQATQDG